MKKLIFALLAIFIATGACKKEKPQKIVGDKPAPFSLTLLTKEAEPGQIVLAQANAKVEVKEGAAIILNGDSALVFVTEDNKVGFIMPVVCPGKLLMDYTTAGITAKLELTIKEYTPITDPNPVFISFVSEMDGAIENLKEHMKSPMVRLDPKYIEVAEYVSKTLKDNFHTLSPDEKVQLAYLLKSHSMEADSFLLGNLNSDFYKTDQGVDAAEALVREGATFAYNMIVGIPTISAGFIAVINPVPAGAYTEKVVGAVLLGIGIVHIAKAVSNAVQIAALKGVFDEFISWFQKSASPVELYANTGRKLKFEGRYRNLNASDQSSSNKVISEIFANLNQLDALHNKVNIMVAKVNNWFPWKNIEAPEYKNPIAGQSQSANLLLPGNKLSIRPISNNDINLSAQRDQDGLLITAQSSSITEETPFTFTVKYTDPDLGIVVEKEVDAVFKSELSALQLERISKSYQVGKGGQPLPEALKIRVTDMKGNPVAGKKVNWDVMEGGGTITSASVTDANGFAKAIWTIEDDCHFYQKDGQLARAFIEAEGDLIANGKGEVLFQANRGYLSLRVSGEMIGNYPATGSVTVNIPGVTSETFSFSNLGTTGGGDFEMSFSLPDIDIEDYLVSFTSNANRQIYLSIASGCRSFSVHPIDPPRGIPTTWSTGWDFPAGNATKKAAFKY